MGPKHKLFSAICSDQEYLWMHIGGTLTQNLFGDFQLSRILMNMHWWNLNTKSFRRFSVNKNFYWHALVLPEHKIFSAIFRYQEYLLTCIGGTWTQNLFDDFQLPKSLLTCIGGTLTQSLFGDSQLSRILWHALVEPERKVVSAIFSYREHLLTCIEGT